MQRQVTFVERYPWKSLIKIKIIKKLEAIVISQVNTEMQYILHEV